MSILSLSRRKSDIYPTEMGGYRIRPGFKNILRIMRLLTDPDISGMRKIARMMRYFFAGEGPNDHEAAFALLQEFIRAGGEEAAEDGGPKRMCFEFDADEIFTSFLAEYGIDLIEEDMHWYRFLALLGGLSAESALQRKIHLRFLDTSGLKGQELQDALEAKEAVQIPVSLTPEEAVQQQAFEEEWGFF